MVYKAQLKSYLTLRRVKGWPQIHPINANKKYLAHSIIMSATLNLVQNTLKE